MNKVKFTDLSTGKAISQTQRTVLCLGNFDGVHVGHTALLREAVRQKQLLSDKYPDILCGVWTFENSPYELLADVPPCHIIDMKQKTELFRQFGIDLLITADFTEMRNLSPSQFVSEILRKSCGCVYAICGYNFKFGAGGVGGTADLEELFEGNVSVIPPVLYNGIPVSSTCIRNAVAKGDVKNASEMLGRAFSFKSTVIHGRSVGSKLGFATINQKLPQGILIPAHGVYISRCEIDGIDFPAISNIGTRPTFSDNDEVLCETHIFGYSQNAYGKIARVSFLKFIRHEMRFETSDELSAAVANDIVTAKNYFS